MTGRRPVSSFNTKFLLVKVRSIFHSFSASSDTSKSISRMRSPDGYFSSSNFPRSSAVTSLRISSILEGCRSRKVSMISAPPTKRKLPIRAAFSCINSSENASFSFSSLQEISPKISCSFNSLSELHFFTSARSFSKKRACCSMVISFSMPFSCSR